MVQRASIYLYFIVLQFFLSVCSKGTIMGYYYDARRDIATESYAEGAISFMKLNAVSKSQTRVLVADHEALKSYLNTDVNFYLFLNETQVDNLKSKKSAVLWFKTQLLTSYRHVKIKGVVVSCNSRDSLLSTLKSIQSTLHGLNLHNQVKVSVALSVPFLENLDKTELHKIIEFIKKEKSYIFLETIDGGDWYVQSFIKRATSILQYNDVSMVLVSKSLMKMKYQHTRKLTSVVEAPVITYPTTPITNPVTPTVATVPATNPVTITPTNPVTTPGTIPSTANPVNSPLPVINPVTAPITVPGTQQPITNPVTTYPSPTGNVPVRTPVITPVMPPVTLTNPQVTIPGQTWCTAKNGSLENALQSALDYACGLGGADCSMIQMGASCYNPNTLPNHASYAFNSYYQKNPSPTSCDFGGTAMLVNINPSTGPCIYPTSSSSLASTSTPSTPTTIPPPTPTATPTIIPPPTPTATPTIIPPPTPTTIPPFTPTTIPPFTPTTIQPYTPTPTSSSGAVPIYGSPPTVLNTSNPASPIPVVYGSDSPPNVNTSLSVSIGLRPFVGCIFLATSFITGKLILDM